MINVLVVEDSAVVRELLVHILGADPGIHVVGAVTNGEEALDAVRRHAPDVITMDIHMPRMGGLEATRQIMATRPTPIVVVSGSEGREAAGSFDLMQAGAIAAVPRPSGVGGPKHSIEARELVRTVKLMAEVKVIRRSTRFVPGKGSAPEGPRLRPHRIRVVGIGASTGGPPVLRTILAGLTREFPAPVTIVQHMAAGFLPGFVEWLSQASAMPVRLATHGESLLPGHAYVAPDQHHLTLDRAGRSLLTRDEPENGLRPSVATLFRSIADACGGDAIAGLLSGMGRDGASELLMLRERGVSTFAQDEQSSVVHGMPGEAIRLGAAEYVLSPDRIAPVLMQLADRRNSKEIPR